VWDVVEQGGRHALNPVLATSQPGRRCLVSGRNVWALESGRKRDPSQPLKLWQVSPESREIVLGGVERTEDGEILNFAVSPDGKYLLLAWQRHVLDARNPKKSHREGQLEFWDLVLARRLAIWEQSPAGSVGQWPLLRFSPDSRMAIVTAMVGTAAWDVRTGRKLRELQIVSELAPNHSLHHSVRNARFSSDGELLFTVADRGRMDKIEVKSGTSLANWKLPEEWSPALALNPAATMIATGTGSGTICLLDAATGGELARWQVQDTVSALAFSSDGKTLVSGTRDGTLKLWDLPAIHKELANLGLDW
jgi:WD40 repeat protein